MGAFESKSCTCESELWTCGEGTYKVDTAEFRGCLLNNTLPPTAETTETTSVNTTSTNAVQESTSDSTTETEDTNTVEVATTTSADITLDLTPKSQMVDINDSSLWLTTETCAYWCKDHDAPPDKKCDTFVQCKGCGACTK